MKEGDSADAPYAPYVKPRQRSDKNAGAAKKTHQEIGFCNLGAYQTIVEGQRKLAADAMTKIAYAIKTGKMRYVDLVTDRSYMAI